MRILIIEDDAFLRRAYEVGLRGQGFEVHAAADGEIGISMAAMNPPEAILLDILMPALSGALSLCSPTLALPMKPREYWRWVHPHIYPKLAPAWPISARPSAVFALCLNTNSATSMKKSAEHGGGEHNE